MKFCSIGIPGLVLGKHNLKDPRLDEADRLVEAKKKAYAQVDIVDDKDLAYADAIITTRELLADLLIRDLEFIETRIAHGALEAEKTVLQKMSALLESEKPLSAGTFTPEDWQAVAAHNFVTSRPVVVADAPDLEDLESFLVRAFAQSGFISFLTVGGKENRAWPIRQGLTAWEAAGTIHTDIQKGFIRAEIIGYDDFIAAGGETEAKRAGKQRLELKTYVMQDYDLTNFRFNK